MKKRVLSLFMAFVLCLTLLPTSAFAAGETYVAEVDGRQYETLEKILGEMEPVEITLLDDVEEGDLTVYAATTINMDGHSITGNIDANVTDGDLKLENGTVKGKVTVDMSGTFTMTAPTNAPAAIDGELNVVSGSCDISGAKIGVKGTLTFGGDNLSISGSEKAVDLLGNPTVSGTIYGATDENGEAVTAADYDDTTGTYAIYSTIAKKISNKQAGASPEPAATLTIDPKTASVYNGQTVTFTGTYTGTDTLNAYAQGNALEDYYFDFELVNNSDGTYTLSVTVDEETPGGDYTLYVHETKDAFVQAKATITVTAAVAKDDRGNF